MPVGCPILIKENVKCEPRATNDYVRLVLLGYVPSRVDLPIYLYMLSTFYTYTEMGIVNIPLLR